MTDYPPACVIDNGALLAFLWRESGWESVRARLAKGAAMSAMNWAEALSKFAERGRDPRTVEQELRERHVTSDDLRIADTEGARDPVSLSAARLKPIVEGLDLSLSDRICLALGRVKGLPVVTTDGVMFLAPLGVEVVHARPATLAEVHRRLTLKQRAALDRIRRRHPIDW